MTLIELLITMVIVAIISAAILGTASAAFENARRSRTQTLITKISGLVLERWDSYANRRVDLNPNVVAAINALYPTQISAAQRGQMLADARLIALRELMMMEMPDRWTDVTSPTQMLANRPALVDTYLRFYNNDPGTPKTELAECLYLTVMYATGDGEARTLFTSQDIGDTDDDGIPEFLDGWGEPIGWIRWPAGFVSEMQPAGPNGNRNIDDHDPFDMFRRDSPTRLAIPPNPAIEVYPTAQGFQNLVRLINNRNQLVQPSGNTRLAAYRFIPLVFSSGSDKEVGLLIVDPDLSSGAPALDPYAVSPDDVQSGQTDPDTKAWRDNIHNHVNQY
jgi:Tfp pilus assembly protein PilV